MGNSLLDDMLEQFRTMSPEHLRKIDDETFEHVADIPWIPNPGPQTEAFHSKADLLLYGGEGGGGKMSPLDSLVLTPKGFVEMGSLALGSSVTNPTTGGVSTVVGIFPQGEKDIWRLTFDDGASLEVGEEHLWAYRRSGMKWGDKYSSERDFAEASLGALALGAGKWGGYKVGTTAELMRLLEANDKVRIPLTEPVIFTVNGRTGSGGLDPYILGVLLGDVHIETTTVIVCDNEVRNALLSCGFSAHSALHTDGLPKSYRAVGETRKQLVAWATNHGLRHCRSWEKFIPPYVLTASMQYRLSFLQGLMDTNGTIDERGRAFFSSTSLRLVEGVQHLVRGLGGKARLRNRITHYTHKGQKLAGRPSFSLRVWLPKISSIFRIERKRMRATDKWNGGGELTRQLVNAEYVGKKEAQCIKVDNIFGLYVADDYIVTHNSDLLCGLAITQHRKSLLMRRQYTDLAALTERAVSINGSREGFSGSIPPRLRTKDNRLIEFGAAAKLGDEKHWQGRPHDFLGFDEVVHFIEAQVRFVMGWVRISDGAPPDQRTRVVMASNPPVTAEGDWIVGMFRPWLDPTHPKPAKTGELRWFLTDPDGHDMEVTGPNDGREWNGQSYLPKSRSFIRASLSDNPYLLNTGYQATLDALPEPLRSAVRDGNFVAARKDAANQAIPSAWVFEAQKRWDPLIPRGIPMCAIGVDCTGGGDDPLILAPRHDAWFARLIEVPGREVPKDGIGKFTAGCIVQNRRDGALIVVDCGGGYGGSTVEHLKDNDVEVMPYKGAEGTKERTSDRLLTFTNKRSAAIWKFREALDPGQPGGSPIALPNDDPVLVADLTAPTFQVTSRGIQVESKESVCARLGRSTDRGDAVVMSWYGGVRNLMPGHVISSRGRKPEVITKRKRRGR